MEAAELRQRQAPWKQRYRDEPAAAAVTMESAGHVAMDSIACRVQSEVGEIVTGLHPATGGDDSAACSANLLLDALVGCAGVTFGAVATALEIPVDDCRITASGDLDFRGTLGVDRNTPVGFQAIRLKFHVTTDASDEQLATLLKLTERYCVVYQTLATQLPIESHLERPD